ncbi:hypothetical protein [Microcoleus sp. PH2017_28_MFU_U_A]|uniref:hypothetical protein n=1 Tax=Microcoleus sp. PH2017_28_MFU_U_A TaxID=2798838 RepID=UPI001E11150B|nr:hypothetical protein [Microcoleus sp. PH2017_28_MFU_U_A]MCC3589562.1 hypothetical protein [Microcoleus sp. PH2017_28_MFU_U_A]
MEDTAVPFPYPKIIINPINYGGDGNAVSLPKIIGRDTALPSPLMAGHPTPKIQSLPPQKIQFAHHPTKSDL